MVTIDDCRTAAHPSCIDLAAYLMRIGIPEGVSATRDGLERIVEHHMARIPFEAIDVLLDRQVSLDPEVIDEKMLHRGRGGYCFEHASLLQRALEALGFAVEVHLARVWVGRASGDPAPPATHASLKVEVDDELWLVDAGFGGFMPNAPIAWLPDVAQTFVHGTYRLRKTPGGYLVESRQGPMWQALYEILDYPWEPIDFQVHNHYVSRYPDSGFRTRLSVALTMPDGRYTLSSDRLRITAVDGDIEERRLTLDEMIDALDEVFGLNVESCWRPMLARFTADG